ncbi:hypothetical protein LCGC14_0514440 [marine sediment metagenome]|uniref:Uncharacterized protein n=1 Tax=marine sediment metagenome TaxID=412755 RepID=A0A0F9S081_9ZZZZ
MGKPTGRPMEKGNPITKQEEIREGVAIWLYNYEMSGKHTSWSLWLDIEEDLKYHYRGCVNELMKKMDKQGVVLKVGRELPEYVGCVNVSDGFTKAIAQEAQQDMLKAGYGAFEPLIEGKK